MRHTIRLLVENIYTLCARIVLYRHHPIVIAITGSAGKTTTKEIIGSVCVRGFGARSVRVGFGNLGTTAGVPMALLNVPISILDMGNGWGGLVLILLVPVMIVKTLWYCLYPFFPHYVVLEVSADTPGDISLLARYLCPTVSVITNIGSAHLVNFTSRGGVAKEKFMLARYTLPHGSVVLPADDAKEFSVEKYTRARIIRVQEKGLAFGVRAAREVGLVLGIGTKDIDYAVRHAPKPHGRLDTFVGLRGATIIDSSYNSNPDSVIAVLTYITDHTPKKSRIIAVLGDMLELGADAPALHKRVGEYARKHVDLLICVGPLSRAMNADYHADTCDDALGYILNHITSNDTIVIKASHGMHFDRIVSALRKENHAT